MWKRAIYCTNIARMSHYNEVVTHVLHMLWKYSKLLPNVECKRNFSLVHLSRVCLLSGSTNPRTKRALLRLDFRESMACSCWVSADLRRVLSKSTSHTRAAETFQLLQSLKGISAVQTHQSAAKKCVAESPSKFFSNQWLAFAAQSRVVTFELASLTHAAEIFQPWPSLKGTYPSWRRVPKGSGPCGSVEISTDPAESVLNLAGCSHLKSTSSLQILVPFVNSEFVITIFNICISC